MASIMDFCDAAVECTAGPVATRCRHPTIRGKIRNPEGFTMIDLTRLACSSVRPRPIGPIGAGSTVVSLAAACLLAGAWTMTGPAPAEAQDFFNIGPALM